MTASTMKRPSTNGQPVRHAGVYVPELHNDAILDQDGLRRLLHLKSTTIRHARQSGALRSHRTANKTWYRGSWVKAWLFGDLDE